MEFIQCMEQRYTTKKYDASFKISPEQITQLQRILQLSPSSINGQPWKFTFVEDAGVREQLAGASYFNRERVLQASHLVVFSVLATPALFEQQIAAQLPAGAVHYYETMVKPLPEAEIRAWMSRQVYLALGVFMSACATMGIDSTPMEGIETELYAAILGYTDHQPLVAVAIGRRSPEDANQPDRRPKTRMALEEVVEMV